MKRFASMFASSGSSGNTPSQQQQGGGFRTVPGGLSIEQEWNDIAEAVIRTFATVRAIDTRNVSNNSKNSDPSTSRGTPCFRSKSEWYKKIYDVLGVYANAGVEYKRRLTTLVNDDLRTHVTAKLLLITDPEETFRFVTDQFEKFRVVRQFCKIIFQAADRLQNTTSVSTLMNQAFYDSVYQRSKGHLASVLMEQIKAYRREEAVIVRDISNAISVFVDLTLCAKSDLHAGTAAGPGGSMGGTVTASMVNGTPSVFRSGQEYDTFRADFVYGFLRLSKEHFSMAGAAQWSNGATLSAYIQWAKRQMALDDTLITAFPNLFRIEARQVLVDALIAVHAARILEDPNDGVAALVVRDDTVDLCKTLYAMVRQTTGTSTLTRMAEVLQKLAAQLVVEVMVDAAAAAEAEANDAKTRKAEGTAAGKGPAAAAAAAAANAPSTEQTISMSLITVWLRLLTYCRVRFHDEPLFLEAVRKGMCSQLNSRTKAAQVPSDVVEQLGVTFASFVDLLCRRDIKDSSTESAGGAVHSVDGSRGGNEDPTTAAAPTAAALSEHRLVDVLMDLVQMLPEKDVFQESCRTKLSKRLLQSTPNDEMEHAVLDTLKRHFGRSFTFKMEQMLSDREQAVNLSAKYAKRHETAAALSGLELSAQVLTASHWPSFRIDALLPPGPFANPIRSFELFYQTEYARRRLRWVHSLGSCTLNIEFRLGAKDVQCTLVQGCILFTLYEAGMPLSCAMIAEKLGVTGPAIVSAVAPVTLHRQLNLVVNTDASTSTTGAAPPPKTINLNDRLTLNRTFKHPQRRFKVPPPGVAKSASSGGGKNAGPMTEVLAEVTLLRKVQVDAAIVRVMKSRRTLTLPELSEQVAGQLSRLFLPELSLIKSRVEDLVNKEFLRRDENDRAVFHYIA